MILVDTSIWVDHLRVATVTGSAVVPGTPVVLFPTSIYGGGVTPAGFREYDVAPDGRFLINTELDSAAAPITLILNWSPDAKP